MLNKVTQDIRKYRLLQNGDTVLVALSGGADSVALLHVLRELAPLFSLHIEAAHIHHMIRGREADRDARFVQKLCQSLNIPCHIQKCNVPLLAKQTGVSLEMAARTARYMTLTRFATELKCNAIATAHSADDQTETVLLKLCRGAGTRGLSGIPRITSLSGIRIIRPILSLSRTEIETFLRARRQKWCEDSTNRDTAPLRNRLRKEIIPLLQRRLNPTLRNAINRTADILHEDDLWLHSLTQKILARCLTRQGDLLLPILHRQPLAAIRRTLRQWLILRGLPPDLVDFDIVERLIKLAHDKNGSQSEQLPGPWLAVRQYDQLTIQSTATQNSTPFHETLAIPGSTSIPQLDLCIHTSLKRGILRDKPTTPGAVPARASFSQRLADKTVTIRPWQPGDRMRPLGLNGSKKVQDILVDARVPAAKRRQIPIFECEGEIIWIPGYRIAEGWQIAHPADPSIHIELHHHGEHHSCKN